MIDDGLPPNELQALISGSHRRTDRISLNALFLLVVFVVGLGSGYQIGRQRTMTKSASATSRLESKGLELIHQVNPPKGYTIPAQFGRIGPQILAAGAIDLDKFLEIYKQAGKPLTAVELTILTRGTDANVVINHANAYFLLNFFWAVGLTNRNPALTEGPMMAGGKDKIDSFASTGGWTRYPATVESVREGLHYIRMNGREVFRFATRVMAQATQDAVEQADLKIDDIQLVIPHQANYRIIETAMRNLKIPMERCVVNLERYGNTSTPSIPIAVCEAVSDGRLKSGHKVVFVGFGAGLTWGAAMAVWSGPTDGRKEVLPACYRLYTRLRSLARRILRRIEAFIWGRRYPSV